MRSVLFSCPVLITLILMGCASEKRLGESRIQPRRYSKGLHVQHHKEAKASPVVDAACWDGEGHSNAPQARSAPSLSDEAPPEDTWASAENGGVELASNTSSSEVSSVVAALSGMPSEHLERVQGPLLDPVPEWSGWEAKELPDPIAGRHPDAVLGFVLSAGWVYGLFGAIALDYLAAFSLVGFAVALGFIFSILGYSLSRRAFRMSKANPDRYPRSGLASAGRWVAGTIIIAALLWLALVLFVLLTW